MNLGTLDRRTLLMLLGGLLVLAILRFGVYGGHQATVVAASDSIPLAERRLEHLREVSATVPGKEMVLKAAHTFNLLDARGAISVTERAAYIGRIRILARSVSQAYFDSRLRKGFPMSKPEQLQKLGVDVATMQAALVEIEKEPAA